ncbi:heme o synthase [Domibacillus sp. A3M-37]|uniref:heme o synthase n=1 Tax=Domibacillus TaxID=1433999 RepID=UPI0020B68D86|nr:heme o synthase [Domibacillus sp. A3M-37]MCP3765036.1 heme o synthase [Domibacillus sp. A3M-37]
MQNTEAVAKDGRSVKQYFSWKVIKAIVKTGIINSNLMGMCAGLSLALYIYNLNFTDYISTIILAILGTAFVVGGSGAINNFYDQDIDIVMKRTKDRPTVDGSVNPKFALWLGIALLASGLAFLLLISPLVAFIGFLGFFLYVFPYTMFTKRKTIYNTEVGSLSGAVPPLIGWAAVSSDMFHPIAIGLFLFMFLWQPPHFYAIAIRRLDEYKAAGVPMLPVIKGIYRTKIQAIVYLLGLLMVSFLFFPFSKLIAFAMFGLTLVWIMLGIFNFRRMESEKWATLMFVFSLNHIMIIFALMIVIGFIEGL